VRKVGACAGALLLATACGGGDRPPSTGEPRLAVLSIAAASDLRYVLDDLVTAYRDANPGAGVSVSYGSSGNLFAQMANGAPFDLFLSADIDYPRRLIADGHAVPDSLFRYAIGRIVIWVPARSTLDIETRGLAAAADPLVRRVAIANPDHAPYGRAAQAALGFANLLDVVKPKLVFGETVSQAFQFVQSGSAELGIIALSLARAPVVETAGRFVLVPANLHPPLDQGGVILKSAQRPDAAVSFRALMTGQIGRDMLTRYGFELPEAGPRTDSPRVSAVSANPEGLDGSVTRRAGVGPREQ
jgi:molybdate transport system substrate-binding protein